MNIVALVIGIASLAIAALHVLVGGRQVAAPMLAAQLEVVARDTLHACWHLISVQLVLAGVYLTYAGFVPDSGTNAIVCAVAVLYLAYAGVFVGIAIASRRPRALLELGQWILFLPLGVIGLLCGDG